MTKPIWPKAPPGFVRAMLASHSALGLFIAALCYLVCVTGTLAVFAAELDQWERPASAVDAAVSGPALDRGVVNALVTATGKVDSILVSLPTADSPATSLTVTDAAGERRYRIGQDGALIPAKAAVFTRFLREFHANLHAGRMGYVIVGLAGVAMVSLTLSGLLAHPRIFRDAFTLRWGGSRRLQEADLHNRLSVWGLPFNLIISVTGAYFGFAGILAMVITGLQPGGDSAGAIRATRFPPPKADPRPAPVPSFAAAAAFIRTDAAVADQAFTLALRAPGTRGQSLTAYAHVERRALYGELYQFPPGAPAQRMGYADGPFGLQLYAATYPLHFGSYGGLLLKSLYAILGFGLSVVCASGVSIWLVRRRDGGRPAPRIERAWTGMVWGALVGLGLSSFAGLNPALSPGWLFWGGLLASLTLAAITARPSLWLKGGLAAILLAIAVGYWRPELTPAARTIEALLVLGAAWAAYLFLRQARPREAP